MTRARLGIVLATALLVWATSAVASLEALQRDAGWVAPPDAASKVNPLADRPDAEAGGRKVFQKRCSTCHGDDGRGTAKGPDLTAPDVQTQADGELFWKISSGNTRTGMPAFSRLPELRRWQLVLHLRSLRFAQGLD